MKKSKTSFIFNYPNLIITKRAYNSLEKIYPLYFNDPINEIGFIYGHKSKINGLWYIGQSVKSPQNRWRQNGEGYTRYNKESKLSNEINKIGWENFEHYILEFSLTKDLNSLELKYINEKDSFNNGLNSINGFGGEHSDSTKRKMKGHSVSEKQVEFIKNLNKGKSSATKGLFLGKSNPMSRSVQMIDLNSKSVIMEFETIKDAALYTNEKSQSNIGKVCRGERPYTYFNGVKIGWRYSNGEYEKLQKLTQEHKKKISESTKGKNSVEKSYKSRKVNMYSLDGTFQKEFISMREAGRFLGVPDKNNHISDVCRGIRKTFHGYIWKYADNQKN